MNRVETCTIINVWGHREILPHNLACQQNKMKQKMHQLNESDCGLIKGNFVNTSVLLRLFLKAKSCVWLFRPSFSAYLSGDVQEKFIRPFKL